MPKTVSRLLNSSRPLISCAVIILAALCLQNVGCETQTPLVEGIVVDLNDANFAAEVLDHKGPVLVDFGATWCGPCQEMEPIMKYLSVEYEGRLKVGKIDIDDSPAISDRYEIEVLPTFVMFLNGAELERARGSGTYESMAKWAEEFAAD